MRKNVWFVLDVRYPTEKAYGVTTSFTATAVESLTKYNATIITPNLDQSLELMNKSIEVRMPFNSIRVIGLKQKNCISRVTYNLWKYMYAFKLISILKNRNSLVWLRDIRLSSVFCILGYKVVCEIHRKPSRWTLIDLTILRNSRNATIAVISQDLKEKLKIPDRKCVIAEMAVNENELLYETKRNKHNEFVVGYAGALHSSGNILSIDVVLEAAVKLEILCPEVRFKFIGFTAGEIYSNIKIEYSYKNGLRDGLYREWYPDGGDKAIECTYKNDKKVGTFTSWFCTLDTGGQRNENDNKFTSCFYSEDNGKLVGKVINWYENGNIAIECSYSNTDSPNAAISPNSESNFSAHFFRDGWFFYVFLGH